MVLMMEPIVNCLEDLKKQSDYDEIIYMSPDGEPLTQSLANGLATMQNIILLCGHYKGIDERLREHFITKEISVGDYVLSGGELAAAVVTDAVVRLLPLDDGRTDPLLDGLIREANLSDSSVLKARREELDVRSSPVHHAIRQTGQVTTSTEASVRSATYSLAGMNSPVSSSLICLQCEQMVRKSPRARVSAN